ncbi:MAG: NAD(P)H-dependent oxidoreductase [Pseudomonadales bacterium]|nr:NAD(P)H-dependent oxidoreductase [Pseudomonadales bacterium]
MVKILAFSGSSRRDSFNNKLVKIAAEGAKSTGASVSHINLADFPMPIYDGDLEDEKGMPEYALGFKQLLIDHDGFLIASPEYNSAFSPLLKNVIDWASRANTENESPLLAYRGKMAAIMSASPGALGGIRGLVSLRMLLGNIGVTLLTEQQTIPQSFSAFTEEGDLVDERKQKAVMQLGSKLASTIEKLQSIS